MSDMLDRAFFERDPLVCARELIGTQFVHRSCAGMVIETEAYHEHGDEACHLFTRPSARSFAEDHLPGDAYVYLNYGVHWLANVLCRDGSTGSAGFVLFRAINPLEGIEEMEKRRGTTKHGQLGSGPGKLARALDIGPDHHGRSLVSDSAFCLKPGTPLEVVADIRVGISAAVDLPWRFLARDHSGVSIPAGKVKAKA